MQTDFQVISSEVNTEVTVHDCLLLSSFQQTLHAPSNLWHAIKLMLEPEQFVQESCSNITN